MSRRTGYEVIQGSSFEISKLGADGMFEFMMGLLDRKNIIIDRLFISNLVYGDLYNYPMMTAEQFQMLDMKASENALTIYLTADEDDIIARMEKRGDDMIKADEISKILEKYEKTICKCTGKMLFQFNTTNIGNRNLLPSLISEMVLMPELNILIKNDKKD